MYIITVLLMALGHWWHHIIIIVPLRWWQQCGYSHAESLSSCPPVAHIVMVLLMALGHWQHCIVVVVVPSRWWWWYRCSHTELSPLCPPSERLYCTCHQSYTYMVLLMMLSCYRWHQATNDITLLSSSSSWSSIMVVVSYVTMCGVLHMCWCHCTPIQFSVLLVSGCRTCSLNRIMWNAVKFTSIHLNMIFCNYVVLDLCRLNVVLLASNCMYHTSPKHCCNAAPPSIYT